MKRHSTDTWSTRAGVRRRVGAAAIATLTVAGAGCAGGGRPVEMALRTGADGRLEIGGWADADGPSSVKVTVDGEAITEAPINGATRTTRWWFTKRDQRSFSLAIPVGPGKHFVCVIPLGDGRRGDVDGAPSCRGIDSGGGSRPTTTTTAALPTPTTVTSAPPTTGTATPPTTDTTAPPPPPTTAPPAPAPTTPPAPAPTTPPVDNWTATMLADVNARRAQSGLPALTPCASLDRMAQRYAELLNSTGHFDHVGPDGSTVSTRATAAGYVRVGNRFALAENIAKGQRSVQEVMNGWMNSPGHRANILSTSVTHIGLGRAGNVWVQNFGTGGSC